MAAIDCARAGQFTPMQRALHDCDAECQAMLEDVETLAAGVVAAAKAGTPDAAKAVEGLVGAIVARAFEAMNHVNATAERFDCNCTD